MGAASAWEESPCDLGNPVAVMAADALVSVMAAPSPTTCTPFKSECSTNLNGVQEMAYNGRMPRDTLTREQIVRTAIALLDAEGLEGFSMRGLGARLGSAATAVYWHVKSKDDLVRLAGDEVWNEIELPDLRAVDWRTAATTPTRLAPPSELNRHTMTKSSFPRGAVASAVAALSTALSS